MVVYTGGNACSLLSDLISIQGLIHIFFILGVVPFIQVITGKKKILHGSEKFESLKTFLSIVYIGISHFAWGERLGLKGKDYRLPTLLCVNP